MEEMTIKVRNPSNCPCGSKWVSQNKDGSVLLCTSGHKWKYKTRWERTSLTSFDRLVTSGGNFE